MDYITDYEVRSTVDFIVNNRDTRGALGFVSSVHKKRFTKGVELVTSALRTIANDVTAAGVLSGSYIGEAINYFNEDRRDHIPDLFLTTIARASIYEMGDHANQLAVSYFDILEHMIAPALVHYGIQKEIKGVETLSKEDQVKLTVVMRGYKDAFLCLNFTGKILKIENPCAAMAISYAVIVETAVEEPEASFMPIVRLGYTIHALALSTGDFSQLSAVRDLMRAAMAELIIRGC